MATEQTRPVGDDPDPTDPSDIPGWELTDPPETLDIYPGERDGSLAAVSDERDFWRHLFYDVVWNFPEFVYVVDEEGTVTHINTVHEGVDEDVAELIVGENAADIFGIEESLGTMAAEEGRTLRVRDIVSGTAETDGESVRWHVQPGAVPIRTPDGEFVGGLQVHNDVTELVENRQVLEELQERMAGEVEAAVEDLLTSAEQVSASSQQIGDIAGIQADNLEEISEEVDQLSATIEEIASSAETVNERSREAEELAEESRDSARTTLEHVEAIEGAGEVLTDNTRDLRERIDEVDGIVHAIDDIADQTNLLALNASIEAARSADGGAGFSVVADEVKQLAEQSKREAGEIEGIVSQITENIETTAENVRAANDRIDETVDRIETLVENQGTIMDAIAETSIGMEEIADATGEQSRSAEEVTTMLADAVSGVNQVSAEIQELAAANERQVEKVREISESVTRLEEHFREGTDLAHLDFADGESATRDGAEEDGARD